MARPFLPSQPARRLRPVRFESSQRQSELSAETLDEQKKLAIRSGLRSAVYTLQ